eukprot:SAG31_NODE_34873_length_328_cov_0.899563_1_plen_108_part_11
MMMMMMVATSASATHETGGGLAQTVDDYKASEVSEKFTTRYKGLLGQSLLALDAGLISQSRMSSKGKGQGKGKGVRRGKGGNGGKGGAGKKGKPVVGKGGRKAPEEVA